MVRTHLIAVLSLTAAACAGPLPPPQHPTPGDLARLRIQAARDPSVTTQVSLAAALRSAGQRDSAQALLEKVEAAHPNSGAAAFYLGLTYEDGAHYQQAEQLYRRYLTTGHSSSLKAQIRDRLALLERRSLVSAMQSAVARERTLSAQPPAPRTVAVFPFRYAGTDTTLAPLSRGLSALLTSDLGQTNRLRVLERVQVQALLDEIRLSGTGLVDSATAVRSGRLLRASRVVQGQILGSPSALQVAAAVVGIGGEVNGKLSPVQVSDPVSRLFDMEKDLAFGLYRSMGIQLTVAERERVGRHETSNLQALLAFGWGLEYQDLAQYDRALSEYARALKLDPNFELAAEYARQARALSAAAGESLDALSVAGVAELYPQVAAPTLVQPTIDIEPIAVIGVNRVRALLPDPIARDPGPEILGTDGVVLPATLVIILRQP